MVLFVIVVSAIIAGIYAWERGRGYRKISRTTPQPGPQAEVELVADKREFLVGKNCAISLDIDIDGHKKKNHFYSYGHSDDWQASTSSEYEYRLAGTDIFVRELHSFNKVMGEKIWKIRDGVVLETDLRERGFNDDDIADLKQHTEWASLVSTRWDGFKYFVIVENAEIADARRFLRQELERLKAGIAAFKKLGVEPAVEPLQRCGITWGEFRAADTLVGQLESLLAIKP